MRPACVREMAATTARSGARAIAGASSEPAHPVAPARHTLISIAMRGEYVGKCPPVSNPALGLGSGLSVLRVGRSVHRNGLSVKTPDRTAHNMRCTEIATVGVP